MAAVQAEDLKLLDHLRQRLVTLADGINALRSGNIADPLAILNRHVEVITDQLAEHAEVLARTVVYPQTSYPGRTQGHLLGQLLRKKLEPDVQNWVVEGQKTWEDLGNNTDGEKREDMDKLWTWAGDHAHNKISHYIQQSDSYTVEERRSGIENVNTGLKMRWFEHDEEQDEEDDEAMEGVTSVGTSGDGHVTMEIGEIQHSPKVGGKSFEDILRFATTGFSKE